MEAEPPAGDPLEAKLELARFIVRRSHGEEAAQTAEEHFTRVVRGDAAPDDVPEAVLSGDGEVHLPALLVEHLGFGSTSEARRLISQGGVKLNGEAGQRSRPAAGVARRGARTGRKAPFHALLRVLA